MMRSDYQVLIEAADLMSNPVLADEVLAIAERFKGDTVMCEACTLLIQLGGRPNNYSDTEGTVTATPIRWQAGAEGSLCGGCNKELNGCTHYVVMKMEVQDE